MELNGKRKLGWKKKKEEGSGGKQNRIKTTDEGIERESNRFSLFLCFRHNLVFYSMLCLSLFMLFFRRLHPKSRYTVSFFLRFMDDYPLTRQNPWLNFSFSSFKELRESRNSYKTRRQTIIRQVEVKRKERSDRMQVTIPGFSRLPLESHASEHEASSCSSMKGTCHLRFYFFSLSSMKKLFACFLLDQDHRGSRSLSSSSTHFLGDDQAVLFSSFTQALNHKGWWSRGQEKWERNERGWWGITLPWNVMKAVGLLEWHSVQATNFVVESLVSDKIS